MPIEKYGVWKATPTSWDGSAKPDHGKLTFTDGAGTYEAAVNVSSQSQDSRLVYWLLRDFDKSHPLTQKLSALDTGWHLQDSHSATGLGLDFLRGNFLNPRDGVLLAHDVPGSSDILDYLNPIFNQAVAQKATMYIYGQRYDDADGSSGIHDIHMNQGNAGRWARDNGLYQDGGVILSFADGHWEGVFLAFAVQAYQTDDNGDPTGQTFAQLLGGDDGQVPPTQHGGMNKPSRYKDDTDGQLPSTLDAIIVQAVLVNPVGPDQKPSGGPGETVYLLNKSSLAISLAGWTLTNTQGQTQRLPGETLPAHAKKGFAVKDMPLSNEGGSVVLKDARGLEVDMAVWTKADMQREGTLVYFRQRK